MSNDVLEQTDADLLRMLSSPDGRRFLWSIIDGRARSSGASFSGENTHHSAYLEGRRSVGLELMLDCQRVSSAEYVHMVEEAVLRSEQMRLKAEAEALENSDGG